MKHSELPCSGVASTVPDNQGFLVQAVQMTKNTRWKLVSTMPQQQNITPYNFSLSYIDYVELDLGKYLTSQTWLLSATAIVNINNPVTDVVDTSHLRQSCAVGLVISS